MSEAIYRESEAGDLAGRLMWVAPVEIDYEAVAGIVMRHLPLLDGEVEARELAEYMIEEALGIGGDDAE